MHKWYAPGVITDGAMTHTLPGRLVPAVAIALLSSAIFTLAQSPASQVPVSVLVTVHDAKGNAVSNLNPSDFRLEQDGEPQSITSFAAMHSGGSSLLSAKSISAAVELAANANAVELSPNSLGRNIAVFFDDTHLTSEDLEQTKAAADKYLTSLPIQDRVAVVTASGHNETDFTTEHNKLHADLSKVSKTWCSPLAYWDADAFDAGNVSDAVTSSLPSALGSCDMVQMDAPLTHGAPSIQANIESETQNGSISVETARGLSAVIRQANDLVTHAVLNRFELLLSRMSTLPGERTIIFISPGFSYANDDAKMAGVIDLADITNVTINTIDATAMVDASIGDLHKTDPLRIDPAAMAALGIAAKAGELRSQRVLSGTGGFFFHSGDDYAAAFAKIMAAPESYYVLTYFPQNLTADGSYHSVRVTIPGANYAVNARHGFFAPTRAVTSAEAAKAVMSEDLFSFEEQKELPVTFESLMTQPTPSTKQITIRANFDISHLALNQSNGINQENVHASAILFDTDGHYLNRIDQVDQTKLSDAQLEDLTDNGYYMRFSFNAQPGAYIARIVVQNLVDGRVSSANLAVSVPEGKIPSLTPKQIAKLSEDDAYEAFSREPNPDQKILLGEQFEQNYPNSAYLRSVRSSLVTLYFDTKDFEKFYPAATQAIAKDSDNVPLLSLVGWIIPRAYDEKNPQFASMLVESEKYDKRALALIASTKKPRALSVADFNNAKANQSWQPHSGLGIAYFRQENYAGSASELQLAVSEESPEVDPFDLYILGLDLQKLHRNAEAVDAFTKCGQVRGQLQAQCQRDAVSTKAPTAR